MHRARRKHDLTRMMVTLLFLVSGHVPRRLRVAEGGPRPHDHGEGTASDHAGGGGRSRPGAAGLDGAAPSSGVAPAGG